MAFGQMMGPQASQPQQPGQLQPQIQQQLQGLFDPQRFQGLISRLQDPVVRDQLATQLAQQYDPPDIGELEKQAPQSQPQPKPEKKKESGFGSYLGG